MTHLCSAMGDKGPLLAKATASNIAVVSLSFFVDSAFNGSLLQGLEYNFFFFFHSEIVLIESDYAIAAPLPPATGIRSSKRIRPKDNDDEDHSKKNGDLSFMFKHEIQEV
jgi:hypothetical protein